MADTKCVCCGKAINFISGCNKLFEEDKETICSSCYSEFGPSYNAFKNTPPKVERFKVNYEAALREIKEAGFKPEAQKYLLEAAGRKYQQLLTAPRPAPKKAAPAPEPEFRPMRKPPKKQDATEENKKAGLQEHRGGAGEHGAAAEHRRAGEHRSAAEERRGAAGEHGRTADEHRRPVPEKPEKAEKEALKTGAAGTEAAKNEATKTEAAKTESAKAEAAKAEAEKNEAAKAEAAEELSRRQFLIRQEELLKARPAGFPMTTGGSLDGYVVMEYKGIVSGIGSAGLEKKEKLGEPLKLTPEDFERAKRTAVGILRKNAEDLGADGILGIKLDLQAAGTGFYVVAAGTAVKLAALSTFNAAPTSMK